MIAMAINKNGKARKISETLLTISSAVLAKISARWRRARSRANPAKITVAAPTMSEIREP